MNLTCPNASECQGYSTCELIAYQTPSCICLPGYTGSACTDVITCTLPDAASSETHFENPSSIYYNDETLDEVCDNGYDRITYVCNGYTGTWYTTSSIDCTTPPNQGLSQGAVIGVSCGVIIAIVLFGAVCFRTYKNSRRTVPPMTQTAAPAVVPGTYTLPTVNYEGSGAQVQGGPTVMGAVGWTPPAGPLPEKGPIQGGQAAPAEMPPPEYSFVIHNPATSTSNNPS
eukprot:XP_011673327.1 PREDICTED: uncharacterized protein LOC105442683 [Strongylocentrotus purpuratus]